MQQQTMATMVPNNAHKDIPGNPSTAKSSAEKLNDRSNGKPLRVLSEEDWQFWVHNGYIVIKQAVPREQAEAVRRARKLARKKLQREGLLPIKTKIIAR